MRRAQAASAGGGRRAHIVKISLLWVVDCDSYGGKVDTAAYTTIRGQAVRVLERRAGCCLDFAMGRAPHDVFLLLRG